MMEKSAEMISLFEYSKNNNNKHLDKVRTGPMPWGKGENCPPKCSKKEKWGSFMQQHDQS